MIECPFTCGKCKLLLYLVGNLKNQVPFTLGKSPVTISVRQRIFSCVNPLNPSMRACVFKLESWLKDKKETLGPNPVFLFRAYSLLDDKSVSIHGSVHNWLNAFSHVKHANCYCTWLAIWKKKVLLTLGKSPVTISACQRIFCCVNAFMIQCFNESMCLQVRILAKTQKGKFRANSSLSF